MMLRTDTENPLNETYAHLLANGLDGAAEALRILVDDASVVERAAYLKAAPFEGSVVNQQTVCESCCKRIDSRTDM